MENWAKDFAASFADHKRLEAEVESIKMHCLMKRMLCRWFGHRFGIKGVTGKYEWCERCATRRKR